MRPTSNGAPELAQPLRLGSQEREEKGQNTLGRRPRLPGHPGLNPTACVRSPRAVSGPQRRSPGLWGHPQREPLGPVPGAFSGDLAAPWAAQPFSAAARIARAGLLATARLGAQRSRSAPGCPLRSLSEAAPHPLPGFWVECCAYCWYLTSVC